VQHQTLILMAQDHLQLDIDHCRTRQQKVRDVLSNVQAERAIFVTAENVQYLTGFRHHKLMNAAVCVDLDGSCTLAAPNTEPDHHAADRIVTFEAQWHSTLRQEQPQLAISTLADALQFKSDSKTAVEYSACGQHLASHAGLDSKQLVDVDADMWRLRRNKYPDELAMIRRAIACTEAMYETAREIIAPGISELEVFNQLHATAVEVAGEPLTALGNDYQCNSGGGIPRPRTAQDGELFILDLGPAYRGYFADNCRAIAVNKSPTDEQMKAWTAIVEVLKMVQQSVKPGVSSRQLFETAQGMLDEYQVGSFCHHLGHGFGLFPHEAPHLNPNWDDVFEEGDVFTAEPGLYTPELRAGIRLEQNYRVTADGVELLTDFSLEL
jgi:Xaa-Pro dipeptidase